MPITLVRFLDSTITIRVTRHFQASALRFVAQTIMSMNSRTDASAGTVSHLPKCDVCDPYGMELMLSIGHSDPRWLAGAILCVLSVPAWAEGVSDAASINMVVASIAPITPVDIVPPIPEPRQYVFHYEMQYSPNRIAGGTIDQSAWYAVPITGGEPHFNPDPAPQYRGYRQAFRPQEQAQPAHDDMGAIAPSTPLIDMFQLTDDDSQSRSHPDRRLAMVLDEWRVSASAHIPISHSRDGGATIRLKRKF